jgi:hypothetical protein
MKAFKYTVMNTDKWRLTDTEIVVIATSKATAKTKLKKEGYDIKNTSELIELVEGVHIIQNGFSE